MRDSAEGADGLVSVAVADEPRIIHALPGRVRLHLARWGEGEEARIERHLAALPGVRQVQANRLTGNVLVLFDPQHTDQGAVVAASRALNFVRAAGAERGVPATAFAHPPRVISDDLGPAGPGARLRRSRIAVEGIERDPARAEAVIERLQCLPGVRAVADQLTGRVVATYREPATSLDDLLAAVTEAGGPEATAAPPPTHPLDPMPLRQSVARVAAAVVGLGLVASRQGSGTAGPFPGAGAAAQVAAAVGLVQGFPLTRNGVREAFGRNTADLVVGGASIVALALSGNPLGLAVAGLEALRLLTEVAPRREAWRRYEERLADAAPALPGAVIRLESGDRAPLAGLVIEGTGTAIGGDGLPTPASPGARLGAGDRLFGGPVLARLTGGAAFNPLPRPAPIRPTPLERYNNALGPAALLYAAALGVASGSPVAALAGLALLNPRVALIGAEAAANGAAARALRGGAVWLAARQDRRVRRPDALIVAGTRPLTDGIEIAATQMIAEPPPDEDFLSLAACVAAASGAPWGGAFRASVEVEISAGSFDGSTATAEREGVRYALGPADPTAIPWPHEQGTIVLALSREEERQPLALFALRPRLAPAAAELTRCCRANGVELVVVPAGNRQAAATLAARAGIRLLDGPDLVAEVRERQATGAVVAVLADNAEAAPAFAACDLAIGLSSGRSSRFPARVDLLAPDLGAVTAAIEAGARGDAAARDAVAASLLANAAGIVWGFSGPPAFDRAARAVYVAALASLGSGWLRLRGGDRPKSALARLADPKPERWGQRDAEDVLRALASHPDGLSASEAAARKRAIAPVAARHTLLRALWDQAHSPINGILVVGAGISLALGSPLDVLLIGATIGAGLAVSVWQEWQADEATAALERLSAATARVLRDGEPTTLPAREVVPGDVVLLAPGDRIAADARLLVARNLEVDEAALTGESLPVAKAPAALTAAGRIVLEGSDVVVGTGRAVVVAVGRGTRMGATAAALAAEDESSSPLGRRLGRLLIQLLPVAGAGGAIVIVSGLLRGQAFLPQLAISASIAIAAVPEGLPLLAGVGQAAVARRLAGRRALVRRLGAVEALGRVDIACTDKTGTLTEGRLALTTVADLKGARQPPDALSDALRPVLLAAALASPHPEAPGAGAHPTDVAVTMGAERAGLGAALRAQRTAAAPFDPARAFHATVVGGRLYVKGAAEALLPRCARSTDGDSEVTLDEPGRDALHEQAVRLAGSGLRVLMVAEGAQGGRVEDPQNLTALGFIGISDPLRPGVPEAVRRCREAGVRVIMLTGDHPATARAIAAQAGILAGGDVLNGLEIGELSDADLDCRLEHTAVIARVTPLDKLRIVESLRRRGHTVAMSGDGVNDAPALRLADVGVAMGRGGTEVARQAADVVLADDDFATLVEALVEGRSFWRNIRRALGLLLGGNLGELGLVAGASLLGAASPLVTRQILAVNLITDALPALAVAMQPPASRHLAGLAREGARSLDRPLRDEALRRGAIAAGPSLVAYFLALPLGLESARAVALGSIVSTQLVQTLEAGRVEGGLTRPVVGAVAASGGLLLAALALPPLQSLLLIGPPGPAGWLLLGGSTAVAALAGRLFTGSDPSVPPRPVLSPRPALRMLPPARPVGLPTS